MATAADSQAILTTRLENLGLTKAQVRNLADYLGALGKAGVGPGDVFPIGIPVPVDIGISVDLTPAQIAKIRKLLDDPKIREIRIFPKGIPVPDLFKATIMRKR